jgi:branched-chain amino acid aminotransferase
MASWIKLRAENDTAGGLIPVVELDGRRIGDGKPGPTYRALVSAYRDALNSSL